MGFSCRKSLVAAAVMAAGLIGLARTASANVETQLFDTEPAATAAGWVGVHNREAAIGTDFGFTSTTNAGAPSGAGEAGGYFPRNKLPTGYYADTTLGTLNLSNPLTATGKIAFFTENLNGGLRLGWFNKDQLDAAQPAGIGISFAEGNRFQSFARFNNATGLSSTLVSGGIGPTPADFTLSWNPTTRIVSATIGSISTSTAPLTDDQLLLGADLNSFGLYTGAAGTDTPTSRGRLYIDDITYTSADAAAVDPPTPQLKINRFTGATRVFGSGGTQPLQFDKYTASSNAANPPLENVWLPANWTSITDQNGGTWSKVSGTTTSLSEQNAAGSQDLTPGASINLGDIYNKASGSEDVTFSYSLANENFDRTGAVVFDGGLSLNVNKQTGNITIINNEPVNISMDGYVVKSASGVLGGTWNSLQDQALTGWEELPTSSTTERSEVNLHNSSQVNANGGLLNIGNIYSAGLAGAEDLQFTFSVAGGTLVAPGAIQYVGVSLAGDYNSDGTVNAADYTVWRDTLNSTTDLRADGNGNHMIDAGDYQTWKTNFGQHNGSGAGSSSAVPEPATWLIALVALAAGGVRRKSKWIWR